MNSSPDQLHNEDALVAGLKTNDQRIFEQLYNRFSAALYGTIINWVKDGEVAENLLQDVFVKAWRNNFQYDETKGRLFTWLYNISRNVCIDYLRSRRYKQSKAALLSEDMNALFGGKKSFYNPTETIGVHKLVSQLRKEEKEVLNLMYFKGCTQKEIAEILGLPLGTVKTRMAMGIKNLRRFFTADWNNAMRYVSAN